MYFEYRYRYRVLVTRTGCFKKLTQELLVVVVGMCVGPRVEGRAWDEPLTANYLPIEGLHVHFGVRMSLSLGQRTTHDITFCLPARTSRSCLRACRADDDDDKFTPTKHLTLTLLPTTSSRPAAAHTDDTETPLLHQKKL